VDWFNELGIYVGLLSGAPALAVDMAGTPGLDAEQHGYKMGYHLQNAPESFSAYPTGPGA
jgi:hypothetical protein